MRADDFKFKVTDLQTGDSSILSLTDITGDSGELYISIREMLANSSLNGATIYEEDSNNEPYSINERLDFEIVNLSETEKEIAKQHTQLAILKSF